MKNSIKVILVVFITGILSCKREQNALVFQSDFGLKDGAVNAMKGVAYDVDPDLVMFDLTHEIPAFEIWDAAYRLHQSVQFWPAGTVFVSIVDPGVGTDRKSIVAKSRSGHFFVTPDNGTLTLIAEHPGIEAIREIDESLNRRPDSYDSHTFHGRDVYAYTGARLASGVISFEETGPLADLEKMIRIQYQQAEIKNDTIKGIITVKDIQFGNIWSNISDSLIRGLQKGSSDSLFFQIYFKNQPVHSASVPLVHTFGDVPEKKGLAYLNSLMNLSLALNQGSYADSFKIGSGPDWMIHVTKHK